MRFHHCDKDQNTTLAKDGELCLELRNKKPTQALLSSTSAVLLPTYELAT